MRVAIWQSKVIRFHVGQYCLDITLISAIQSLDGSLMDKNCIKIDKNCRERRTNATKVREHFQALDLSRLKGIYSGDDRSRIWVFDIKQKKHIEKFVHF